jgi:hypothetical protein
VEKLFQSRMQGDEYEDQHTLIKNWIYYFVYGVRSTP